MGDRNYGAPEFDHLVYVRVTEACNVHCEHCFIPNNPKTLSIQSVSSLAHAIESLASANEIVLVQFHGGEPTLLGGRFLTQYSEQLIELLPNIILRFSIQTNLLKLDNSLIGFYRQFCKSTVGVSWDTDIRHKGSVSEKSNNEFNSVFWKNFETLNDAGITPFVVMTVTKNFLDRFSRNENLVEFCTQKQIRYLHLEKLTRAGYAIDNWSRIGVDNLSYSQGMAVIYKDYKSAPSSISKVHISPFDDLELSIRNMFEGKSGGEGCLSGKCDSSFHTFDQNGYSNGCTALTATNKNDTQIVKFIDVQNERKARINACETCTFNKVCNSGCLKVDINDGSGECSGNRILFNAIVKSSVGENHAKV